MVNNIFEQIYNSNGLYGLQSKDCITGLMKGTKPEHRIVMVVWRSPYANADRNNWLERRLRKIYTSYYLKVLIDTMGRFW